MEPTTITGVHSLKLVPLTTLSRFARIKSTAHIVMLGDGMDAGAIPGSITATTGTDEDRVTKRITYKCAELTAEMGDWLATMKARRLIALYVDERGNDRVCGSPDWPLTLDYTPGDGVYEVTLTGADTAPDLYLAR